MTVPSREVVARTATGCWVFNDAFGLRKLRDLEMEVLKWVCTQFNNVILWVGDVKNKNMATTRNNLCGKLNHCNLTCDSSMVGKFYVYRHVLTELNAYRIFVPNTTYKIRQPLFLIQNFLNKRDLNHFYV